MQLELTPEETSALLQLLGRVQITGAEAPTIVRLMQKINQASQLGSLQKKEPEIKEKEKPKKEGNEGESK